MSRRSDGALQAAHEELASADALLALAEERAENAEAEVERLRAERAAVIDCLNIFAEPIVHEQLTAAGLLLPEAASGGAER